MRLRLSPSATFPCSQQLSIPQPTTIAALLSEVGLALGVECLGITVHDDDFDEWIVPEEASEVLDGMEIRVDAAERPGTPPPRSQQPPSPHRSRPPPTLPAPNISPPTGARTRPTASSGEQALADELSGLKPSALRKRAITAGVSEEELEAAEDSADPKRAMVELVLSRAPPPAATGGGARGAAGAAAQRLRRELSSLKPSALRRRAIAAGVSEEELEEAADADDPRAATIELIAAKTLAAQEEEGTDADWYQALLAELSGLKPSALRKRAIAVGVSEKELEDAADADEPKAEMIQRIVEREAAAGDDDTVAAAKQQALLAELATLKPSGLRRRAVAAGASGAELF